LQGCFGLVVTWFFPPLIGNKEFVYGSHAP